MPFLSVRGSQGLHLVRDKTSDSDTVPKWEDAPNEVFLHDDSKNCKVMAYNSAGDLFAWSNYNCVKVASLTSDNRWILCCQIDASRVSFLAFSPLGSILATWEVFAIKAGQTDVQPNQVLWDPKTGQRLSAFIQKKALGWCPQWSRDEQICCVRSQNNEVFFYRENNFSDVDKKLSLSKMNSFSLGSGAKAHHVVCFVPGQKGGPSFGKLFKYPNFHPEKDTVACKSFFQADHMETEWSHDGSMVLLLTQSEVDKTGASYYGKQQLHFMNVTGDTAMVQLAKDGPIYSIQWSPTTNEFCVVYGYMPAKATLFNHKCEKVFDFGTGPRNMALYNLQGTLLLLGGFGNLRGNIEIWAIKDKKQVCQFEASDSTDVKWSPSGVYLMTSTCAPRLRQGNGLKIWHYTSSLLHEQPLENPADELWEVTWQNVPREKCPPFPIQYKPIEGIVPRQPQASKQAYRPPGMRNKASVFKLHDEDEPAENQKKKEEDNLSKSAAKNKKRREMAKKKGMEEMPASEKKPVVVTEAEGTGDAEKDKKLRKLNEKLQQVIKLKHEQAGGKQLELNQLEKLKKEADIIKEIAQLKL